MTDGSAPSPLPGAADGGPDRSLDELGQVSLRLLAGTVSKRTFDQLQRELARPDVDADKAIRGAVLAEPVDAQQLQRRAAAAQREWVARGGRTRAPSLGYRAKGLLARLCAQLIVTTIYVVLIVVTLLALKYRDPQWDIYRLLDWARQFLPG